MGLLEKINVLLEQNGIMPEFAPNLASQLQALVEQQANSNSGESASRLKSLVLTEQNYKEGTHCPVCEQHIQMYWRTIDKSMAKALITLYRATITNFGKEYFHVEKDLRIPLSSSGISKLQYWGFVQEMSAEDAVVDGGAKRSGRWAITETGILFVLNRASAPKYAKVYNGVLHGMEGEQVDIIYALGKHFNYNELMEAPAMAQQS